MKKKESRDPKRLIDIDAVAELFSYEAQPIEDQFNNGTFTIKYLRIAIRISYRESDD
ncbi:MAG: hypothetical protein HQK59_07950 [Deltaproteobacteria bacterium]|nr:hypothetical protein [Deltaproteobacteria bacterium]